jgi:WD40 repeat protein
MKILPHGNGADGHAAGHPILAVAFSPIGDALVSTAQDRTLCLWSVPADLSLAARKSTKQWAHRSNCIAIHPNGGTLATGQSDGAIQFWSLGDSLVEADRIDAAHAGGVQHVAFSRTGQRFASAGEDGKVVMWDTASRTPLWSVIMAAPATSLAFSWDTSPLAESPVLGVCGDELTLYDANSGTVTGTRSAATPIRFVTLQRGYHRLMAYGCESGEIIIEKQGSTVATLTSHSPLRWLSFGTRFLGVARENATSAIQVQRWPAEATSFQSAYDDKVGLFSPSPNAYAFSLLPHRIACGTRGGDVWVW